MAQIDVTTQAQLDKALGKLKAGDWIVCPGGTRYDPLIVRGSSHVVAWGSSHVEASRFVSVHKMPSHRKTISGGVIIEVPDTEKFTPAEWCDYYGVKVSRGSAVLYKALDDGLSTSYARRKGIVYTPGLKVTAPDWLTVKECGNGLHCSPHPAMAESYNSGASRYVAVKVKIADAVVLGDKVKVPSVSVLHECDRAGAPLCNLQNALAPFAAVDDKDTAAYDPPMHGTPQ